MSDYRIYGWRIASEVELSAQLATAGAVDLTITVGERHPVGNDLPQGRRIAHSAMGEQPLMTVVEDDDGILMRVHTLCDYRISLDLSTVVAHPTPDAADGLISILSGGSLLAVLLTLGGHLTLHASGAVFGDRALAFVAGSGMGKSTMAGLATVAGAQLLTDDVLRVDPFGETVWCYPGTTEVRLRRGADEIAGEDARTRPTADGRTALSGEPVTADAVELGAIVVPFADPSRTEILAEREPGVKALLLLSAFPRLAGWTDPETASLQFDALAAMVDKVPVWRTKLPWGPPFDPALVHDLTEAIGLLPSRS
jgi:hypothetical protein